MTEMNIRLHTGTPIPEKLVGNIARWTQPGLDRSWLTKLPGSIEALCAAWQITLEPEIPPTEMTLVLLGHSTSLGPVVIKSSPLTDEFRAEAAALQLAAGESVVKLHAVNLDRSLMVLERILPGTQLREVEMPDEAATRLAAGLVSSFWRDVSGSTDLHPLRRWMGALFDWQPGDDRIDAELIAHGQAVATRLLAASTRTCLLHGDFQHFNVLRRSTGAWVIIDPKGLAGDPGFEFAAWMYNPPGVTERADYRALALVRAAICSEVWGIEQRTLLEWAFAGAVLSACWSAADATPEGLAPYFLRGAVELQALL